MHTIQSGDAVLAATKTGEGPAMVWLHGGPGLWDYLEPLAEMTPERTVIRSDQRACGNSTGEGPFTVAQAINDLEAIRRYFDIETWTVAGHSWGAMLAIHYALAHPKQVDSIIYLSGVGFGNEWHAPYVEERKRRLGPERLAYLRQLEKEWDEGSVEAERAYCQLSWASDFLDIEEGLKRTPSMLREGARVNRTANREIWPDHIARFDREVMEPRLRSLKIPALFIHGEADPRPHWAAKHVADAMPNAEFVLIRDAGHMPWFEKPGEVAESVRGFVSGH